MVSGVLPIAINNATKIMPALQKLDKEYVGIMRLHKDVSDKDLNNAVKRFIGRIKQTPPVRSAVARKERERTVYSLDILEKDDRNVLFKTHVESGTYIRVICHQVGGLLGGAHMAELRRTRVGPFSEQMSVKMHDLADAYAEWKENKDSSSLENLILPVESAVQHLKKAIVKDTAVSSVCHGSPLYGQGVKSMDKEIKKDSMVAIMNNGKLLGLGTSVIDAKELEKSKLAIKIDRVIAKI